MEAFWQYTKSAPGANFRAIGGGLAVRSQLASTAANTWFLSDPAGPVETAFQDAASFFGPKNPWRVISDGPRADEVGRAAEAHGLKPMTAEPGMVLDPIRPAPSPPPGLTIRKVAGRSELDDFSSVWCSAFRIPRWVFPMVLPQVLTDDPRRGAQNRLLVGYAGGRPVACSSVVVTEGVAGIVSVGTTAPARGKGYGTAMTWQAVEEGRRLGSDVAYLGATAMGYPVYEAMGFRRVAEYPSWGTPLGFFQMVRLVYGMWRLSRRSSARSA